MRKYFVTILYSNKQLWQNLGHSTQTEHPKTTNTVYYSSDHDCKCRKENIKLNCTFGLRLWRIRVFKAAANRKKNPFSSALRYTWGFLQCSKDHLLDHVHLVISNGIDIFNLCYPMTNSINDKPVLFTFICDCGLRINVTEEEIRKHFMQYGTWVDQICMNKGRQR